MSPGLVLACGAVYLALLFVIAFVVDALAAKGRAPAMQSPHVYALALGVYCTSWTFFGAVGTAVRSGLEFVAIYIGPTLVLMAWSVFLPKLVRVAKAQRVTSIADFLSARFGKSRVVAVVVTLIASLAIIPYLALQLLAVSQSFRALTGSASDGNAAFWTAAAMAFFVIVFGTRRVSADESQPGIVAAVAFESVVKLLVLVAVAVFALTMLGGSPRLTETIADVIRYDPDEGARWTVVCLLSAMAILCLPRQFQMLVVENRDERHLPVGAWAFPAYLFVMTLAVVPIAAAGLIRLPEGAAPDLFVIALPLSEGATLLALAAFIGGLSAATSMVIVATLALAVMISNHIIVPLLGVRPGARVGDAVLASRRVAIVALLAAGWTYAQASDGVALAAIGLTAFAGVAQFAPALLLGLFWRGASRSGALFGLIAGAGLWLITLVLPTFGLGTEILAALRGALLPPALALGPGAVDPLVFGTAVSLALNAGLLVAGSLLARARPIDQLQATVFVDALDRRGAEPLLRRSADRRELQRLAQRIVGPARAHALFTDAGAVPDGGDADSALVSHVERELGHAVGAASAHALVAEVAKGEPLTFESAVAMMRETHDAIGAARALGVRHVELERTAEELRVANQSLMALLAEKDAFLSRVSHEMRTPVTAIRAFAELLAEAPLSDARKSRFLAVIRAEAERLTRLFDDILDLSRLEAGIAPLRTETVALAEIARAAVAALEGVAEQRGVSVTVRAEADPMVTGDPDRLKQVLVNLISNGIRYGGAAVVVAVAQTGGRARVSVSDAGNGIPPEVRPRLFSKFAGTDAGPGGGAGLGLAISREIARQLGGTLVLEATGPAGSVFTLALPLAPALGAAAE